jgi:hypothetical protein
MLPAPEMLVRRVGLIQAAGYGSYADHVLPIHSSLDSTPKRLFFHYLQCPLTDNDADNDVSDVASLASAHASTAASTASTAASSPRMAMNQSMLPPPLASPIAPGIAPATRRAVAQKRVDELSGEGSQSEGLDSPT